MRSDDPGEDVVCGMSYHCDGVDPMLCDVVNQFKKAVFLEHQSCDNMPQERSFVHQFL